MGYEIVYSYHRRLPDGQGYNKEETETINRRIGEPFDDVPLDKVAAAIMQQMARRDVWVIGVEIHEYKKNKVTFKETDGGIVIKNRKFQLDQGANLISQELKSTEVPEMNGHRPAQMAMDNLIDPGPMPVIRAVVPQANPDFMPAEQPNPKRRVRRWVAFQPELPQLTEARQKGLKCTENKRYPVFEEKEHPMGLQFGQVLTILDDMQREVQCSDKYFVPAMVRLERDNGNDPFSSGPDSGSDSGGKLIWPGEIVEQQTGVPDVRRAAARGERLPPSAGFDDGMGGGMDIPMPDIRRGRGR